jgi:hypothetical protein
VLYIKLYRGQICPPSHVHCTHVSYANVLNESWGQVAALVDLLKKLEQDAIELCVLEATLASPGQWGTDGEGDDNIVGVLLLAAVEGYLSVPILEGGVDIEEPQLRSRGTAVGDSGV